MIKEIKTDINKMLLFVVEIGLLLYHATIRNNLDDRIMSLSLWGGIAIMAMFTIGYICILLAGIFSVDSLLTTPLRKKDSQEDTVKYRERMFDRSVQLTFVGILLLTMA